MAGASGETSANRNEGSVLDWEVIKDEFVLGQATLGAVANAHGIQEGALRRRASEEGWERKRERFREKAAAEVAHETEEGVVARRPATQAEIDRELDQAVLALLRRIRSAGESKATLGLARALGIVMDKRHQEVLRERAAGASDAQAAPSAVSDSEARFQELFNAAQIVIPDEDEDDQSDEER